MTGRADYFVVMRCQLRALLALLLNRCLKLFLIDLVVALQNSLLLQRGGRGVVFEKPGLNRRRTHVRSSGPPTDFAIGQVAAKGRRFEYGRAWLGPVTTADWIRLELL